MTSSSRLASNLDGLDLSKHNSAVGTIVRLNAGFIATIACIVSFRLYIRLRIVRRVGSDDILMVFAGLFTIALSAMCIVGTRFGLGRHEWDLNPATVIDSTKEIIKVLYATAVTVTKASIIASYLRILPKLIFRRLMYITAAVVLALWVCSIFITIFQCDPVQGAWDFTLQKKKCINILSFFYLQSSVNILTDFVLCTSPLPLFWKLNLHLNDRVMLCVLFSFGLFATIASVIRVSQLHNILNVDFSYVTVSALNWSVVEVGTGIICASVPSMKPIITHLFPAKFFSAPRETSRRTPRTGVSVRLASERGERELETGLYLQRSFECGTQDARSIRKMSSGMQGSDEEILVSGAQRESKPR